MAENGSAKKEILDTLLTDVGAVRATALPTPHRRRAASTQYTLNAAPRLLPTPQGLGVYRPHMDLAYNFISRLIDSDNVDLGREIPPFLAAVIDVRNEDELRTLWSMVAPEHAFPGMR